MPSIRWVPKFGMIRWRVAVYVQPINPFEPGMSLMYVYKHIYILPIFGSTYLDVFCSINIAR
jgi:hypothetical protein